jgi:hypothetical protein
MTYIVGLQFERWLSAVLRGWRMADGRWQLSDERVEYLGSWRHGT